jgi:anti-sigma factor RsiW
MRSHDFWTDRLSEHLDGSLPAEQADGLEEHLAGCPACREVRDELQEVRRRARALGSTPPETDLWARIAPALDGATGDSARRAKVIPMHGHPGPSALREDQVGRGTGSWFAQNPLRAAAAAVLLLGAGAMAGAMVTRSAIGSGSEPMVASMDPAEEVRLAAQAAVEPSLFAELSLLEEALRMDLARLDSETRVVILANLETIDRAIRESVAALQRDPESRYLRGHLGSALHRKVGYLQSVTRLLES